MYGIYGIDDEESLRQLLGTTPLDDDPEVYQAQQAPPPDIASGLLGDTGGVTQQLEEMTEDGSDVAALMAQTAQGYDHGIGANRIAQQQQANQAAIQQAQQSRGGGLLGKLAGIALNIGIGNMVKGWIPKRGGA